MWTRGVMRPNTWARLVATRSLCTPSPQQSAKQTFPRDTYQLVSQQAEPDQQPAPPRTLDEQLPPAPEAPAPVHGVRHLETLLQRGQETIRPAHFGRVLSAALAQKDYPQAEAAYALVEAHLPTPDVAILTAALQIYARNGAPLPGMEVLERMRAHQLRPDAASLGAFLGGLCDAQEYEKAYQVVAMIPALGLDLGRQEVVQALALGLGPSARGEDREARRQVSAALLHLAEHGEVPPPPPPRPREEDKVVTSPPPSKDKGEGQDKSQEGEAKKENKGASSEKNGEESKASSA